MHCANINPTALLIPNNDFASFNIKSIVKASFQIQYLGNK